MVGLVFGASGSTPVPVLIAFLAVLTVEAVYAFVLVSGKKTLEKR